MTTTTKLMIDVIYIYVVTITARCCTWNSGCDVVAVVTYVHLVVVILSLELNQVRKDAFPQKVE